MSRINVPKELDFANPAYEFYYAVARHPLLDGELVEDVDFTSGQTVKIKHKLNRPVRGFIVVKRDADATFYTDTTNTRPASELWLTNSLAGTVKASFWVF